MPDQIPAGFVPHSDEPEGFIPEESDNSPSSFWKWTGEPLTTLPSRAARWLSDKITEPHLDDPHAYAKGFLGGSLEGLGNEITELTTPRNIITTAAFGMGAPTLGRILSVPVVGSGLYKIYNEPDLAGKGMGLAEAAGGLAGVLHAPEASLPSPKELKAPPKALPPATDFSMPGEYPYGSRTFIGGERGVAEQGKTYPVDTGQNPDVLSGTVPPDQFGMINRVSPNIAATYGEASGHAVPVFDQEYYTPEGRPMRYGESRVKPSPDLPVEPDESSPDELTSKMVEDRPDLVPVGGEEEYNKTRPEPIQPTPAEEAAYRRYRESHGGLSEPEQSLDDLLSKAGTSEGVKIGADIESLGKVLGASLYQGDIGKIATKELLQNSFDAVRDQGANGKIHVMFDPKQRFIQVADNGKGLSYKELQTVFTDLGSSGKRNDVNAIGGFGLAKAAPLLGGERVQVESIAQEPDGKIWRYTFGGTPSDMISGVKVDKQMMPDGTPTGLKVRTYVPSSPYYESGNADLYGAEKFARKIAESSSHDATVKISSNDDIDKLPPEKLNKDYITQTYTGTNDLGKHVTDLENSSANVGLYIPHDAERGERRTMSVNLLNNGMYQGTYTKYFDHAINTPEEISVNIKSKVPEGDTDYPFTANRENLRGSTLAGVDKYINDNIIKPAVSHRTNEIQRLYDEMPTYELDTPALGHTGEPVHDAEHIDDMNKYNELVKSGQFSKNTLDNLKRNIDEASLRRNPQIEPAGNAKFSIFDAGGRYTKEELDSMMANPIIKNLATSVHDSIAKLAEEVFPKEIERIKKTGFVFSGDDKSTLFGLNVRNPSNSNENAILINPFANLEFAGSPDNAASRLSHVILHEFAHQQAREEGAGFTAKLAEVYDKAGFQLEKQIGQRMYDSIIDPNNPTEYHPEIQKLLQQYTESRGREETTPDLLSGTAAQLADKRRGGTDEIPEYSKSNAERASAKLANAINEIGENREAQEEGYTQERARRFNNAKQVNPNLGQAGFNAEKSRLRGELPKVGSNFALDEDETNALFSALRSSKLLSYTQSLHARQGLQDLLNGNTPQRSQIKLISRVLGPELGDAIYMHGGLFGVGMDKLGSMGIGRKLVDIGTLNKTLMASMDLSAPLRQALPLIHRPEYWGAFRQMFKMAANPEFYDGIMQSLQERPNFTLGEDAGLKLTIDHDITSREEAFMSPLAEKIPGVTASERGYTGFLNKLRADTFDSLIKKAQDMGHDVQDKDGLPTKVTKDIAKYVNNATGRGSLGSLESIAPELNTLFFSPRMISSRLWFLNPNTYIKSDLSPMVRQEALKSLFAVAGAGLTVMSLGKMAGGTISANPTDADFGKVKFGNTRLDPYGGFQQYVVAAMRLLESAHDLGNGIKTNPNNTMWNTVENFGANKLSPIASFIYKLATAHNDSTGTLKDRYGNKINMTTETMSRFIPMVMQDTWDVLRQDPELAPLAAVAGTFGMGVQTYNTKPAQSGFRQMNLR